TPPNTRAAEKLRALKSNKAGSESTENSCTRTPRTKSWYVCRSAAGVAKWTQPKTRGKVRAKASILPQDRQRCVSQRRRLRRAGGRGGAKLARSERVSDTP